MIQSNLVNPALLSSGNLLFGQNVLTQEFFIIRKSLIRNLVQIRNKFNRNLNFFHIY